MNQLVITEGGLALPNYNLVLREKDISATTEPDENVDLLADLEKAYFSFDPKKEFASYLNLFEKLSLVIKGSFSSPEKILEAQINNYDLDQTGWKFLVNVIKFLYQDANTPSSDTAKIKLLDRERINIGRYFVQKTFKSSVDVESLSKEVKLEISKVRTKDYNDFLDATGLRSHSACVVDNMLRVLYRDTPLTLNLVRLFFFKEQ